MTQEATPHIFDPAVETRPLEKQFELDKTRYLRQVRYLFEHSPFYRRKLQEAGFADAGSAGGLEDIHHLPFTTKDELRESQAAHPPFGDYLAADPRDLVRIFSTSGMMSDFNTVNKYFSQSG